MTLPASGAISLSQVNTEIGYASNAAITLNDAAVRSLAGVPSGQISMSDLYGKSAIPAGLIIMSADGSTPTGWTRFSASDGRFIVGAGSSYAVAATGGSSTVSTAVGSSTSGSHTHVSYEDAIYYASGTYFFLRNTADGDHSHTASCTEYTPEKQNMVLIKASSVQSSVPANGMFFGTSTPSGFSVFSAANFLFGASSVSTTAHTRTITCSSNGDHSHSSYKGQTGTDTYDVERTGAHVHTLTIGEPTKSFKHALLRGLYKAAAYALTSGLIGMWEGTTAPSGWYLCDGSNGTVDLRDYFILFSTTGTGTKPGTGTTVSITVGFDSKAWSHDHQYQNVVDSFTDYVNYNSAYSGAHSHTSSGLSFTYTPVYYALTFIQKA